MLGVELMPILENKTIITKEIINLSKSGFINGDIDKFKLFIKEKGLIE